MQAPKLAVQELTRCVKVCVLCMCVCVCVWVWVCGCVCVGVGVTLIVQELGFSGVEIGSHIRNGEGEDWNLDHPELQCVFAVSIVRVYNTGLTTSNCVGC